MKKQTFFSSNVRSFVAVAVAVVASASSSLPVIADSFDDQINQKRAEAQQLKTKATELNVYGNTLQEAVNNLNAQIAALEAKIAANQQKMQELNASITKAEADIAQRNKALGDNLRMMYHESEVSNLEKVASSKSISDFVDKQEARNRLQDKVKGALDEIKNLKKQLEAQKVQVQQLLKDDEAMRGQVAAQRAEQARLLEQTRGEEAAYQQQVNAKNSEISNLQKQQADANRRLSSGTNYNTGGTGSYPWANEGFPCSGADPWGMCFRQCVSYTAWKVASTGRHMPYWGGIGNANEWPGNAENEGIPTGSEPRKGAVAILMYGQYGHAMYVEEVLGGGKIKISQYNRDWDGRYSTDVINSSGLVYIYF